MRSLSDFHVHTQYSKNGHAKGSIEEVVLAAREAGLTEVLISDHGPGHFLFGIHRSQLPEIRREIDRLNGVYEDIDVLMGLESNVMSYRGSIDLEPEDLAYLDRLSVGFHYGIMPRDLWSFFLFMILNPLSKLIPPLRAYVTRENTNALVRIVKRYRPTIITHPGSKVPLDIRSLARVCGEFGTALEINSSHGDLNDEGICIALKEDVKFSLGSDAHSPRRVGDLTYSIEALSRLGVAPERLINRTKKEDQ
ncbi:MAG: PHP domain-containing protein [Tissierellia bacterium]|nr:PHP domain-containing protein [Tissierellia bacterium]